MTRDRGRSLSVSHRVARLGRGRLGLELGLGSCVWRCVWLRLAKLQSGALESTSIRSRLEPVAATKGYVIRVILAAVRAAISRGASGVSSAP